MTTRKVPCMSPFPVPSLLELIHWARSRLHTKWIEPYHHRLLGYREPDIYNTIYHKSTNRQWGMRDLFMLPRLRLVASDSRGCTISNYTIFNARETIFRPPFPILRLIIIYYLLNSWWANVWFVYIQSSNGGMYKRHLDNINYTLGPQHTRFWLTIWYGH